MHIAPLGSFFIVSSCRYRFRRLPGLRGRRVSAKGELGGKATSLRRTVLYESRPFSRVLPARLLPRRSTRNPALSPPRKIRHRFALPASLGSTCPRALLETSKDPTSPSTLPRTLFSKSKHGTSHWEPGSSSTCTRRTVRRWASSPRRSPARPSSPRPQPP